MQSKDWNCVHAEFLDIFEHLTCYYNNKDDDDDGDNNNILTISIQIDMHQRRNMPVLCGLWGSGLQPTKGWQ